MTSHLDDGTVHELIDGEIASAQLPPIRQHLATCAECTARVAAAQAIARESDELIESLDVPAVSAPSAIVGAGGRRNWMREAAWAASLVVAVGAGYMARGVPGIDVGSGAAADTIPAPPVAPAAAPVAVQHDTAPSAAATRESAAGRRDDLPREARRDAPPPATGAAATVQLRDERPAADATTNQAAPVAHEAAPPAAPAALGGVTAGTARSARPTDILERARLSSEMMPRDQITAKQMLNPAPDTVGFSTAVRMLGGRLRLVEGLVPSRLELRGGEVRVIYRVAEGDLVLAQSVVNGALIHRLVAPPGFSLDSLAKLQRKVQE